MLTPRRCAQLGLGAACLILVSSVAVLVAGAADSGRDLTPQNTTQNKTPVPAAHMQAAGSAQATMNAAALAPAVKG